MAVVCSALLLAAVALLVSAPAEACVDFAPGVQGSRFVKGLWQYKRGDFGKAATLFREALSHREIDIIYLNLAWSLMEQGACAEAWEAYAKVLDSPHICGSPTKEELDEELRFALNRYQRQCGSLVSVSCEGADRVVVEPWSTSPLHAFVNASGTTVEGCPEEPISVWPGNYQVHVVRGSAETVHPVWVAGGAYIEEATTAPGTVIVSCPEAVEVLVDGRPFRKCRERLELQLPAGVHLLEAAPAEDGAEGPRSRVTVRPGGLVEVELGESPRSPARWVLTVPARVTLVNFSPQTGDGLLHLTGDARTGDIVAVGIGEELRKDAWRAGGRVELGVGRLARSVEGYEGPWTATSLAPVARLEVGLAPFGDAVSVWVGGGLGAAFYVEDSNDLAPGGQRQRLEGTALRWTAGGRLCASDRLCAALAYTDDLGVALEERSTDTRRRLRLGWWSVGVELDLWGWR